MILRRWTGRIRTPDKPAYVLYIARTGGRSYAAAAGNLGWQVVVRELGDETTEVTTLSWWRDMEAIRAFAGSEPERAVYFPDDHAFLIDPPSNVDHFHVMDGSGPLQT